MKERLQSETGSRLVTSENCYDRNAVQEENNPLESKRMMMMIMIIDSSLLV
jgi:hypothetical protein